MSTLNWLINCVKVARLVFKFPALYVALFSWVNTPEKWLPSNSAFCMLSDAINVLPQLSAKSPIAVFVLRLLFI